MKSPAPPLVWRGDAEHSLEELAWVIGTILRVRRGSGTVEGMNLAAARLARAIAGVPRVRLAFLFGSRARGCARPGSDWDVAVLLDEEAAADSGARRDALFEVLGALGNALPEGEVDVVLLDRASPLLRHRVLRDGVLLHARSPEDRVRFAVRTIREYQDGERWREEFTRRLIRRLKEGPSGGGPRDLLEEARSVGRLLAKARGPR